MMDKIIHNIWLSGFDTLPEKIRMKYMITQKKNSSWEFIVWDNSMVLKLLKKYPLIQSIYKNIESYIVLPNKEQDKKKEILKIKTYIARYVILKENGGVYYDLNLNCPFEFDSLFLSEKKDNMMFIVKNTQKDIGHYIYYLFPFLKNQEYDPRFMAFTKNHPMLDIIIQKLTVLKTSTQIDLVLEDTLNCNNEYEVFYLLKEDNDCYKVDTSFMGNSIPKIIKYLHCYYKQIYLLFIIILLLVSIHHLTNYNSQLFSIPSVIPGVPNPGQNSGVVQGKKDGMKKKKEKK